MIRLLVAWRRRVTGIYVELLRAGGWLSPGELPAYLTAALRQGRIKLPPRVLVAGLETPAPWKNSGSRSSAAAPRWSISRCGAILPNVREAVALPDPGQELHWVAAQLVELAQQDDLPLHRLAVTAPDIDTYAPQLRRVLAELLGPPQSPGRLGLQFLPGAEPVRSPPLSGRRCCP